MTVRFLTALLLICLGSCSTPTTPKDGNMGRISPHDTVSSAVNGANIKIIFGSPAVKGRQIWGGLVPYDKAWRGGADEATLFTIDKELTIGDQKLPAGTYSVFVIPSKDKWTYLFNSQTGQWGITEGGAANYDSAKTVLTVTAVPAEAPMAEHLAYTADDKGFGLHWEKLEALVPVK